MEPILEKAVGSFGGHFVRWLSHAEMTRVIETVDAAALARKGIFLDPFDIEPTWKRRKYKVTPRASWPEGADPFRLGPAPERSEAADDDPLIEWSLVDRANYEAFAMKERAAAAGASAQDDPFHVSVNRRPTDGDLGPFAVTVKH